MSLWIAHILIPVQNIVQCSWGLQSSGMLWCVDEWLCNIPITDAVKHPRRLRTSTAQYLVHYSNLQLVALPFIDSPSHTWTYDLRVDDHAWSWNKYHGVLQVVEYIRGCVWMWVPLSDCSIFSITLAIQHIKQQVMKITRGHRIA